MNTTIIIVAYKSEELIQRNIEQFNKDTKIIIIDNSQNKNFKEQIEKKYENIKIYLNKNEGFGQAANLGINLATTKYVLFCSPDNFIEKGAVDNLERIAKELNDDFGLLILSDKNQGLSSKVKINKTRGFLCSFVQKKIFLSLTGFDEKFFLYYEDADLVKRILKKKLSIYEIPIKYTNLLGSHNKQFNHPIEVNRNFHLMWSKFYYKKNHFGYVYSLISTLPYLIRSIFRLIIYLNKPEQKEIYLARISGLCNSYILKDPLYRPKINQK